MMKNVAILSLGPFMKMQLRILCLISFLVFEFVSYYFYFGLH